MKRALLMNSIRNLLRLLAEAELQDIFALGAIVLFVLGASRVAAIVSAVILSGRAV